MSHSPRISVVMGIYNGAEHLAFTIESVLSQTMTDLEFIIVDDGSTDETPELLERFANADSRLIVVTQENAGLTKALMAGCSQARGEFIARQDVGDGSLPNRLQKQLDFLEANPDVVAVGGGCRRIGPKGEFLGETVHDMNPKEVTDYFLSDGIGLSHPVSMYRREAYEAAGGYRSEFRFAQDTDLWFRMLRVGYLANVSEVLVELRNDVYGISSSSHDRQRILAMLAWESFQAIERGDSDAAILEHAKKVSWEKLTQTQTIAPAQAKARAENFIGSQLYALGDSRCREYLWRAVRSRPYWLRPWTKLFLSFLTTKKATE